MAPSDPVEVQDFSSYRSPCACANCLQNGKQAALDFNHVNQRPFDARLFHREPEDQQDYLEEVNFECLSKQQEILEQVRDLLEIRPSVIQNYQELKKSLESSTMAERSQALPPQAVEGLASDSRIKVQQLCQEWWDCTQEDNSMFNVALAYESSTRESYLK